MSLQTQCAGAARPRPFSRPLFFLLLGLLLAACDTRTSPAQEAAAGASIVLPDTSFAAYRSAFRPVTFPFAFCTDTAFAEERFIYGTGNDLTDSTGRSLSELLLPRRLMERWLADTLASGMHDNLLRDIAVNPARFYDSLY